MGYAAVVTSMLVGIYYNVIIAWALYYFVMSMTSVLPWSQARCDDCRCVIYGLLSDDNNTVTDVTDANGTTLNCCK